MCIILQLFKCFRCDGGRTVKVPNVESYVMVLPPQQPSLVINGTANLASDYHDFREGVKVFTDVHVGVSPPGKSWKSSKCFNSVISCFICKSYLLIPICG